MDSQHRPIHNLQEVVAAAKANKPEGNLNIDWTPIGKNWDPYNMCASFRAQARKQGFGLLFSERELLDEIINDAMSGDYTHLITVLCQNTTPLPCLNKPKLLQYTWDASQRLERYSQEHLSTWAVHRIVEQVTLQQAVFEAACGTFFSLCFYGYIEYDETA